jgi:apolipoprotein N-acyltransferase
LNGFPARTLLLAVAFGVGFPMGLPGYDIPVIPFLSLVPLIELAVSAGSVREAARRGFAAGTLCNLFVYYWIAWTVAVPGNLGWVLGAAAVLAVSAFVAGFTAALCAITRYLVGRLGISAVWTFPVFLTCIEMGRIHLFTGFPWMLTGYALAGSPLLRQGADLAGTLGLGFAIALVNVALHRSAALFGARRWKPAIAGLATAMALIGGMTLYGRASLKAAAAPGTHSIRVGIAQGGIDQNRKWDPALQSETVDIYRDLTLEAVKAGAKVVVWPETAAPFFYGWEGELTARVDNVAQAAGAPIVFGAPWFSPEAGGRYYNSVFLLDARGVSIARYDKRHLVPFGEYVPLRRLLPFISKLTAGEEDFSCGTVPAIFPIDNTAASPSVCYEAVFPEIVRESVLAGAGWLINVTNDAWFGDTVAPHQHLAMARMRAVELRRPMVRAANSGISALIRSDGEIDRSLGLGKKGIVVGEVRPGSGETPFAKTGEMFGYSCIIIGFLTFLFALKGTHGNRNPGGSDSRP